MLRLSILISRWTVIKTRRRFYVDVVIIRLLCNQTCCDLYLHSIDAINVYLGLSVFLQIIDLKLLIRISNSIGPNNPRARKFARRVATHWLSSATQFWGDGGGVKALASQNSKTCAKIRRISRTVRRIDSSFRGRCYEMDPCTAPKAREREREEREDLSVAKLSSTSSPSRRPTTTPRDHSRYPSAERPSRPLTPVITSTNVQGIAFRDRTLEAGTQIRWNRPANTGSQRSTAVVRLWDPRGSGLPLSP